MFFAPEGLRLGPGCPGLDVWVFEGFRNTMSINTITIDIIRTAVMFNNFAKYARRLHAAQSSDPKGIQEKIHLHFAWHGVLPVV